MKRINWFNMLLIVVSFFIDSKSVVYGQDSIDFSFEKTGPNHSVLVLPAWHPVIKELQQSDSLPTGMVLGLGYPNWLKYVETSIKVAINFI